MTPVALQAGHEYDVKIECYGGKESKARRLCLGAGRSGNLGREACFPPASRPSISVRWSPGPLTKAGPAHVDGADGREEVLGPVGLSGTPKNDPAYPEQVNWRGRYLAADELPVVAGAETVC